MFVQILFLDSNDSSYGEDFVIDRFCKRLLPAQQRTDSKISDYQYNHREGKKKKKRERKEKPLESISQGPGWNSGEGEETLSKEKKNPSSGAHLPGDSVVRRQRP